MSSETNEQPQTDEQTQDDAMTQSVFTLPNNPTRAVQEMIEIISSLQEVYEAETQALEDSNAPEFSALQDHKLEIAQKYHSGVQQIVARKDEMRSVDASLKKKLQAMHDDFSKLTQKNIKALKRMGRGMERLSNVIREAAKEAVQKQRGHSYGETGILSQGANKRVSMGINETA